MGGDPGDFPPTSPSLQSQDKPQSYNHQLPELADNPLSGLGTPNSTLRRPRYIADGGSFQ